jgi:hypothetical protein
LIVSAGSIEIIYEWNRPWIGHRAGVNNWADRRPPIIGFNANPLLVNGNMLAATDDTFGRYLFVGLTAKY